MKIKNRRTISLVVCIGLILTGSAFAIESDDNIELDICNNEMATDYVDNYRHEAYDESINEDEYEYTCGKCVIFNRSQYYIDNYTDAEKREIEASVCKALTQIHLESPPLSEDQIKNAIYIEDLETMLAERMNDSGFGQDHELTEDEINSLLDAMGSFDSPIMANNAHLRGPYSYSFPICNNHYIYPNASGRYICVYTLYDVFQCLFHNNCDIIVPVGTFTGVIH